LRKLSERLFLRFSFDLYDLGGDGFITPSEVCDMLFSLIPGTAAYNECMILAELFINSHLNPAADSIYKIQFKDFPIIMNGTSLVGREVLKAISTDGYVNYSYQ
jgi:hypothetical protein